MIKATLTSMLVLATMLSGLLLTALLAAPTATADPSRQAWSKLRMCESSDRYHINTGNGYYGAYQFDLPTWRSVGGSGYPHQASPREQDYRALYLYRIRGWQPWQCARQLGLREDSSANSDIKPSYSDSEYIGGSGDPDPDPNPGHPRWPGRVFTYGDCNDNLRTWQLRMNAHGYDFQGTGCYYNETKTAAIELQRANGIKDSGIIGPKTWKAAWEGRSPDNPGGGSGQHPRWPGRVFTYGDCNDSLRTWQLRMNAHGYDFQGTGCYYNETKTAAIELQRANGIKDSGIIGPKTWKAAWEGRSPR